MTAYHGGKQRIGKKIAQIIVDEIIDFNDIKGYCEPFAGMLGVYQHIPELFKKKNLNLIYEAGDINESVIKMLNAAKNGWKPPTENYGKENWYRLKNNGESSAIKGFVGHCNTFRGQYFNSYFAHPNTKIKTNSERVISIGKKLHKYNIQLSHNDYTQYSDLKGYVIYCDPPYSQTNSLYYKGDSNTKLNFDSEIFFDWCRKMSQKNIVFVSEYNCPPDFKMIWSKIGKLSGLRKGDSNIKRTEKLFVLYPN